LCGADRRFVGHGHECLLFVFCYCGVAAQARDQRVQRGVEPVRERRADRRLDLWRIKRINAYFR